MKLEIRRVSGFSRMPSFKFQVSNFKFQLPTFNFQLPTYSGFITIAPTAR
ncbi:Uncharacterized protein dnm_044500 [Desulfonema magnum]|uniref:Uncharacterized protein n=1 Tax=Desulfonema magnum TaxID=45655 RepID=A0A975BNY8_9BACT|nr:Uncharacterized protein dnm_044500 [Desulfonema magnum]